MIYFFILSVGKKIKYCNIFKILQYRTTKQYFIAIFHTKQYHIAISYRYQYILQYLNGNQYNIVSNNIAIYCSAIILCGLLYPAFTPKKCDLLVKSVLAYYASRNRSRSLWRQLSKMEGISDIFRLWMYSTHQPTYWIHGGTKQG